VIALITTALAGATSSQAAARFGGTNGDGSVTMSFQNKKSIHVLVTR
jgi:hypothetical protein